MSLVVRSGGFKVLQLGVMQMFQLKVASLKVKEPVTDNKAHLLQAVSGQSQGALPEEMGSEQRHFNSEALLHPPKTVAPKDKPLV